MIEIRDYIDARGKIPYRDWVVKLDVATRARILASVLRMSLGNFSGAKSISAGLSEIRQDFGPGYRVYFGNDGEQLVLLLGGGTRKKQQADIDTAHALWAEYKTRKREEK